MGNISIPVGVAIWGVIGLIRLGRHIGSQRRLSRWLERPGHHAGAGCADRFPAHRALPGGHRRPGAGRPGGDPGDHRHRRAGRGAPGAQPGAGYQDARLYSRRGDARRECVVHHVPRDPAQRPRPLLVDAMLRVGYAIFAIGTLGFLGIGLPPPDPDWGNMVNEARRNIFSNPVAVIWPSLAIATLVIGLNLFADGLREEMTRYQK